MRTNLVKQLIRQNKLAMGVMCLEFATPGIGRISAEAGAQFIVYDMEHTGWELETIRRLVAYSRAVDIVPFVRVPTTSYHFIAHALDVGAMGIVVPLVNSADQAREAVRYALYPPQGQRGCAFALAHDDFKGGDIREKMAHTNDQVMVVAQIESVQGVEAVEQIAAVEGIDALWIGQFDLTVSMGIPAQFDHPEFLRAVDRVLAACKKHGKAATYAVMDPQELADAPARGFQLLLYVGDLWIYQQALRRCYRLIRDTNPDRVSPA
jgi:2-dehydro-3-deoxyglucarate aldolase/4-hydroxy-2-oxoheptanedioate aldolase